jgi:hypothetical protein
VLKVISDIPDGILGFEVSGKLEEKDYRDVLVPALQEAAASGPLRVVIVITAFDGLTPGALWEDLKMGVRHWSGWKRIAIVTDGRWITRATGWFAWLTPGDVKCFPLPQRDAAIEWAGGQQPESSTPQPEGSTPPSHEAPPAPPQ